MRGLQEEKKKATQLDDSEATWTDGKCMGQNTVVAKKWSMGERFTFQYGNDPNHSAKLIHSG